MMKSCKRIVLTASLICAAHYAAAAGAAAEFSFRDTAGQHLDMLYGGKIVGRYMYAYDISTPEKHRETYKTYLHVFDKDGGTPITKGAGGQFTHHRGIFIGWSKLGMNGKTYDFWHMREGAAQVHKEFAAQEASGSTAAFISLVDWTGGAGETVVEEERTIVFHDPPSPAYAMLDFKSALRAPSGDVVLDGDPEHAGIQYRPAAVDVKRTAYSFPDAETDLRKDKDIPWVGVTYVLGQKLYSVVIVNHPDNPEGACVSAYREYGRFGYFPTARIKSGTTVTFKYRFIVAEGGMPPAELIQKIRNEFTGASDPTPAMVEKISDQ